MGSAVDQIRRSATFRIIAGFTVAAGALALIGWLVTGPFRSAVTEVDASIRWYARQLQSPLLTSLFLAVTKLGSTLYLSVIGSVVGLAFIGLRWFRPLVLFIITMAGQAVLHYGAKFLFARPRPPALLNYPIGESFSFPSGHALSSMCLFISASWLATNRLENSAGKAGLWAVSILLVLLIGVSRIYIGVHYPTDVLTGYIAAAIWTAAVISVDRKAM